MKSKKSIGNKLENKSIFVKNNIKNAGHYKEFKFKAKGFSPSIQNFKF
jgi:hypothetical protein